MRFQAGAAVFVLALAVSVGHVEGQSSTDRLSLAEQYLKAREATMQEGARPADVEKVLSLCSESLVYEHPQMGIKMTGVRDARAGMINFLGSTRKASVKITASLPGKDMVAVQTDVEFEAKDGAVWKAVRRQQVWVFEFKASRIERIIEYW